MKKNLIITDTETTGLSHHVGCEVIQIAAKALNGTNLDDHHAGEFSCLIKPQHPEKAQAGALKVIGPLWDKALKEGIEPKVAWSNFLTWCSSVNDTSKVYDKPIICGHNLVDFDMPFIQHHCLEHKLVSLGKQGRYEYPWGLQLDSYGMVYMLFENDPQVENMKLDTILRRLGLSRSSEHHDAMEDVRLLAEVVRRSLKFCRAANKRMQVTTNATA